MRKTSLLVVALLGIVVFCFAQKNPTKIHGTVNIDSNTSMKITEVTIEEWMGFIVNNNFDSTLFPNFQCLTPTSRILFDDLKKKWFASYFTIVIYSGKSRKKFGEKGIEPSKKIKKLASSDTAYFHMWMPVTGISYSQATRYCKWKESVVNSYQAVKVNISLPSIEMYNRVIQNKDTINPKLCYQLNSLRCSCANNKKDENVKWQGRFLLRADCYWPDESGMYSIQGNAAEMTSTEGIAMGGSFRHYAIESFRNHHQQYSKPEDWLGFRYVVTLQ